jgi:hypothetical protein
MSLKKTITDLAEKFAHDVLRALRNSSFQDLAALHTSEVSVTAEAPKRRRRRRHTAVQGNNLRTEDVVKTSATAGKTRRSDKSTAKKPSPQAKKTAKKRVARPNGFNLPTTKRARNSPDTNITNPETVLGAGPTEEGTFT